MTYYFSTTLQAPMRDAIARTKAALAKNGFGVLTEIDVTATMKAKNGADMSPYVILGAMLPLNFIVHEETPGIVELAAIDPVASMQAIHEGASIPAIRAAASHRKSPH